ncbi:MAG: hypothetical protein HC828_07660 [Blastochloris sp.]|nr:hypothetical protein [Blastochloris sp.]
MAYQTPLPDALIAQYTRLFLDHQPAKYSRMNGKNATYKYTDVLDWTGDRAPLRIQTTDIADHLSGRRTYAVPLIGAHDLTNKAAIELDQGGVTEVRYVLHIAHALGYHAFAITSENPIQGHSGGHIWFLFDEETTPERLYAAMEQIRDVAVLPKETELYPTYKKLRLPGGVHRWTNTRGTFLTTSNETTIDLNDGLDAIAQMLAVIDTMPRNRVADLPPLPSQVTPTQRATGRDIGARATAPAGRSGIVQYNKDTDLLDWLTAQGGRQASNPKGRILLHCPCGRHRNHDAHPSLEVRAATNDKYGDYVAIGHSPNCLFHTERVRSSPPSKPIAVGTATPRTTTRSTRSIPIGTMRRPQQQPHPSNRAMSRGDRSRNNSSNAGSCVALCPNIPIRRSPPQRTPIPIYRIWLAASSTGCSPIVRAAPGAVPASPGWPPRCKPANAPSIAP